MGARDGGREGQVGEREVGVGHGSMKVVGGENAGGKMRKEKKRGKMTAQSYSS